MGRNRDQGRQQNTPSLPVNQQAIWSIITEDRPETLVTTAKTLAAHLVQIDLTTSQIRTLFTAARQLQTNWLRPRETESEETTRKRQAARRQFVLLKPKLAYQARRTPAVQPLADWLDVAIDTVAQAESDLEEYYRFSRFMEFFEAVLAYHTALGGKQEQRSR
ncbi:MAG TPA: type III-A CRISPR-associated protein Csm2 [Bellilinea sp.]|nr:type III-A CRISPR-associated protein Csm2 [Bellilinea sp.]